MKPKIGSNADSTTDARLINIVDHQSNIYKNMFDNIINIIDNHFTEANTDLECEAALASLYIVLWAVMFGHPQILKGVGMRTLFAKRRRTTMGSTVLSGKGARGSIWEPRMDQVVLGFKLEARIGEGASGMVWRASHPDGRRRALKFVQANYARAHREFNWQRGLDHPNLLSVEDVGTHEGYLVGVLELLEQSLDDFIDRRHIIHLPLRVVYACAADVLAGLKYFHGQGFIHRDIKPANILTKNTGIWKLADFGLIGRVGAKRDLTKVGESLGTPAFWAPEQKRDAHNATAQSDLYSLGVTLLWALAGELPRDRDDDGELPLVCEYRPELPPGWTTLVQKATAKNPRRRYQTADAMLRDIQRLSLI